MHRSLLLVVLSLSVLFSTVFLLVVPAFSQTSLRQELIDEHIRRQQTETLSQDQLSTSALIPPTCLPAPLPSSPRPPVFTMEAAWFGERVRFDVWREPCTDNSGRIVPLLRATPLSGTPFVCGPSFAVIQAGIQYDIVLFPSSTQSSSLCDDLFVPTTSLIGQFPFMPQFNDTEAFQLIYQSDSVYTLNIPPAAPQEPPSLTLLVNQTTFAPGQTLRIDLAMRNPGPPLTVDVYVGAILSDGHTVLWLTQTSPAQGVIGDFDDNPSTFTPLLRGVTWPGALDVVQDDYLTYTWQGGEGFGVYHLLVGWTVPDSLADGAIDPGDVVALGWVPLRYQPRATARR